MHRIDLNESRTAFHPSFFQIRNVMKTLSFIECHEILSLDFNIYFLILYVIFAKFVRRISFRLITM